MNKQNHVVPSSALKTRTNVKIVRYYHGNSLKYYYHESTKSSNNLKRMSNILKFTIVGVIPFIKINSSCKICYTLSTFSWLIKKLWLSLLSLHLKEENELLGNTQELSRRNAYLIKFYYPFTTFSNKTSRAGSQVKAKCVFVVQLSLDKVYNIPIHKLVLK